MELAEARSIANKMKGHFRAFEKLEEFLELVAATESGMAVKKETLDKLTAEELSLTTTIETLKGHLDKLRDQISEEKSQQSASIKEYDKKLKEKQAEFENLVLEAREKMREDIALSNAQLAEHREKAKIETDEISKSVLEKKSELNILTTKINKLKKSINAAGSSLSEAEQEEGR